MCVIFIHRKTGAGNLKTFCWPEKGTLKSAILDCPLSSTQLERKRLPTKNISGHLFYMAPEVNHGTVD